MKEVAFLDIADHRRLVLSIGKYQGQERVDLRQNILSDDKKYIPTKAGINFNVEWIDKFVSMINKLNDE